jgi:ABC-2 type transport system permease protein
MNSQSMKTLWALMRRELWESPVAFKWTPIGIGIFLIFLSIITLIIYTQFDASLSALYDGLRLLSERSAEKRSLAVTAVLFSVATLFFQLMLVIILFYLSGSLYDDRKDRSILFWKSLPVSDTMTVASKVLTACLLVPAMFLLVIMLTHLVLLLFATILSLLAGINPITTFWLPSSLPRLWTVMALGLVVQALWLLPIYAWITFCSSWAPRLPILIAFGIPAGIALVQHSWSLATSFTLPGTNIGWIILQRLGSGVLPSNIDIEFGNTADIDFNQELFMSFGNLLDVMLDPAMWIGLGIAAVLLVGAVWFRRRATDN